METTKEKRDRRNKKWMERYWKKYRSEDRLAQCRARNKIRSMDPNIRKQRHEYYMSRRVLTWAQQIVDQSRRRAKAANMPHELDRRWIESQFSKQEGLCYYTRLPMVITSVAQHPRKPSIDRIDSSKGYTKDNVVLCMLAINTMKGSMSETDLRQLLSDIRSL